MLIRDTSIIDCKPLFKLYRSRQIIYRFVTQIQKWLCFWNFTMNFKVSPMIRKLWCLYAVWVRARVCVWVYIYTCIILEIMCFPLHAKYNFVFVSRRSGDFLYVNKASCGLDWSARGNSQFTLTITLSLSNTHAHSHTPARRLTHTQYTHTHTQCTAEILSGHW